MSPRLLRPRAAGGFDPRAISGLALWLDASDSTTVTLNGSNVSQWRDKSGNNRHAAQSTAANQPAWNTSPRNGRSTITWSNSSFMNGAMASATAYTVFAVIRYQSTSAAFARFFTLGRTGAADNVSPAHTPMLRFSSGEQFNSFGTGAVAAVTFPYNQFAVLTSAHDGTTVSNRLNGGTAATASYSLTGTNFTRYAIGAFQDGTFDSFSTLVGETCEYVTYTRGLSLSEQETVWRYLGQKWGITTT